MSVQAMFYVKEINDRATCKPIQSAPNDLKASVLVITEKMVTQNVWEWRTERSAEDCQRTDAAVKDLRENMVPREELDRIFVIQEQWRQNLQDRLERVEGGNPSRWRRRVKHLDGHAVSLG